MTTSPWKYDSYPIQTTKRKYVLSFKECGCGTPCSCTFAYKNNNTFPTIPFKPICWTQSFTKKKKKKENKNNNKIKRKDRSSHTPLVPKPLDQPKLFICLKKTKRKKRKRKKKLMMCDMHILLTCCRSETIYYYHFEYCCYWDWILYYHLLLLLEELIIIIIYWNYAFVLLLQFCFFVNARSWDFQGWHGH